MDEQPDVVSSGPGWFAGARRSGPGRRRGWVTTVVLAVLVACLGVSASLALLVAHRDATISDLRGALRNASHQAPAVAPPPAVSGSGMFTLPYAGGGAFSVVAVAIRPAPGSPTLTSLFVFGRHASPGQRYGVLDDTCGGQYIAAFDLAEGTADRHGNVTIVAPDLAISPRSPAVWVLVYRLEDGAPLGGVQGPLTGYGGQTFRSPPRC